MRRRFVHALGTVGLIALVLGCSGDEITEPQNIPPAAVDDSYTTSKNTTLTVPDGSTDLSANDTPGRPAATIASFGGGSLGGAVTDHAAGATATVAPGGSLTVNADGSFSFTPPTDFVGTFTFRYRTTNAAGSATATVTITVQAAPAAVADAYTTQKNTALAVPDGTTDLLGNDDLGFPTATLTSFGGGTLGGAVTDNAAGSTVTLAPGGSLTVNADGSFTLTPATGFTGPFTFLYRATNAVGTSDATVTVTVEGTPGAVNDAYGTPQNTALTVPDGAGDLLGNDDPGFPAGALTSFGGGSLGGAVTDHAAGTTASVTDGSVTVNADGSFTFTPSATFTGAFTFLYRITNASGTSDATVTIDVGAAPAAQDDPSYTTPKNTPLTVPDGPGDLLDNDALGSPAAPLTSFGGGSLGGAVTDHAAGATANVADGSVTANADGSFTFTPSAGFTGLFTFDYRITNASGMSDATATISVTAGPTANADTYPQTVIGNVSINSAKIPFSVTGNNDDLGFPAATITAFDATSTQGGTVTMTASGPGIGQFTYDPPAGFGGNDTFTYTLSNAHGSSTATVTLPVADMIWFIDNSAASAGDGRLSSPFNSLAAFVAVNDGTGTNPGPGDNVFLYESGPSYVGPASLLPGQKLIGQDATSSLATLAGITVPSGSTDLPAMNTASPSTVITSPANGVDLAAGNDVHGLTIANTTGPGIIGTSFGTLAVSDVDIVGMGQALDLTDGAVTATFGVLSSDGSAGPGVRLATVGGSLSVANPGSAITSPAAEGVVISGGTATVTYPGSITTTATRSVAVSNQSAGTITFGGPISDGTGIRLTDNGGSTIAFTGTLTLNTGSDSAFTATGAGTVTATGPGSRITTTGAGITITNTTIGPAGVTFRSVSVNGAANGIVLRFTGTSGGLTVTGDGMTDPGDLTRGRIGAFAGTGGTIQNTTGDAVVLERTSNVTLRNMVIGDPNATPSQPADAANNIGGDGIDMTDVSGLTLDNVLIARTAGHGITGAGGGNSGLTILHSEILNAGDANNEVALDFGVAPVGGAPANTHLFGTALIQNSVIATMADHGVVVRNNGGTLTLTVENVLVADNDAATLCGGATCDGHGVFIEAGGSSIITLRIEDSEFTGIDGDGVIVDGASSGRTDLTVQRTSFHDSPSGPSAIAIVSQADSNTFLIEDVDIVEQDSNPVRFEVRRHLRGTITATGVNRNSWDGDNGGAANLGAGLRLIADGLGLNPRVTVLMEKTEIVDVGTEGVVTRCQGNASASAFCNVTIRDVTLGSSAAPLFSDGIAVRALDTFRAHLLIDNAVIHTDLLADINLDAEGSSVLHATVTNNTLTAEPFGLYEIDVETELPGSPTMCADIRGNVLGGTSGTPNTIRLANTAGSLSITQTSLAALSADNNAIVSSTGTIGFNATCTTPPLP